MGRLLLSGLIALVGAAIVHIAVIFAMPLVADNNAWGRLSRLGDFDRLVRVDPLRSRGTGDASGEEGSRIQDFAFVDPAFVIAGCRFSLDEGPMRLSSPGRTEFWSASIYSRQGDNLYSINDRSAVDGQFDLLVGTAEQLVDAKANSAEQEETAIPVEVATSEGYLTLRVLVGQESERPAVDAFVRSVTCEAIDPVAAPAGGDGG